MTHLSRHPLAVFLALSVSAAPVLAAKPAPAPKAAKAPKAAPPPKAPKPPKGIPPEQIGAWLFAYATGDGVAGTLYAGSTLDVRATGGMLMVPALKRAPGGPALKLTGARLDVETVQWIGPKKKPVFVTKSTGEALLSAVLPDETPLVFFRKGTPPPEKPAPVKAEEPAAVVEYERPAPRAEPTAPPAVIEPAPVAAVPVAPPPEVRQAPAPVPVVAPPPPPPEVFVDGPIKLVPVTADLEPAQFGNTAKAELKIPKGARETARDRSHVTWSLPIGGGAEINIDVLGSGADSLTEAVREAWVLDDDRFPEKRELAGERYFVRRSSEESSRKGFTEVLVFTKDLRVRCRAPKDRQPLIVEICESLQQK